MFISGKHDAVKATEFNLAGPLSVGFAYVPTGSDGIKYEFEIIRNVCQFDFFDNRWQKSVSAKVAIANTAKRLIKVSKIFNIISSL